MFSTQVPGGCTNDHSVLQGPTWDWAAGYPTSIPASTGAYGQGVKLVANADCASCADVAGGGAWTVSRGDETNHRFRPD